MQKERIIQALQGFAIGDSFAVGVEMKSRSWILEHVDFTKYVNVFNGGKNNISPGTYSDDTEHTIAVCEALLESELKDDRFHEDMILAKCKHEYDTDKARKGFARNGHGSIEKWYKGEKTIDEVRQSQSTRADPGNAPVMRSFPFAFVNVTDQQLQKWAIVNANATHPHPQARLASYLTIQICRHFLWNNKTPDLLVASLIHTVMDIKDFSPFGTEEDRKAVVDQLFKIDNLPSPDPVHFTLPTLEEYIVLHGVQPLPPIQNLLVQFDYDPNVFGLPCSSLKTVWTLVYILKHVTNPFDALKASVNMGGDVDSLAAICVGITAGLQGLSSIPEFIVQATEGMDRMVDLGTRMFANNRNTLTFWKCKYPSRTFEMEPLPQNEP